MLLLALCCLAFAAARGCELRPEPVAGKLGPKSPGDNYYRLIINGDVERYAPDQRYVVTLVGSRTHSKVQQFTRFQLVAEPLDPASPKGPSRQGQFHLFADTLTKFHEECTNSVTQADDLPKSEVVVMWKAPPAGSGCVLLKAMVYENNNRWFAEDGQLTRRVCEDTSLSVPDCCACDDAKYKMVFEGLWSAQTHPKDFPTQTLWLTHFSDVIGATHTRNFTFWGNNVIASDGFKMLAEWGSVGLMERELRQRGSELRSIVKAQGLWYPKVNTNTTGAFTVDKRRHMVSLASMFGPSPDWVVGVSGLDLCRKDCTWVESKTIDLFPWDAGTDSGISYMSPNAETNPREKMRRITPMYPEDPRAPFYDPHAAEVQPMARLYLTREKLIHKGCDEETLLSMVAEEQENTQTADRPECAVGGWSAWSACSVSCGKGLRMRTREYRLPQKAQMFSCDRQLVSKEMCVAAVPECEEDSPSADEDSLDAVGPADPTTGVCAVGAWGPWSECSVTCGVGVSMRRRTFLNHMGLKKCPLVQIEDNRKCMEPPCPAGEAEGEISDPACPTTAWAAWSPCSASCGRGVRLRTRLLLVPPERAMDCGAKVELLQQRPCQERDDCTIDMATAKQICMESPEQGPCRGMYQRWAFTPLKGMCVPFQYGGCRGNRNNFLTQEDCMETCKVALGGAPAPGGAPSLPPGPFGSASYPGLSVSSNQPQQPRVNPDPSLVSGEDCVVSAWSDWGRCSVSCGLGYQERTRTVLRPPGPSGASCPPRLMRRRRCSRPC